ncbi:MAG: hypothetical protein COS94_01580, partial [Candidatus Hydrogenedentes bacterium CG07_land_8_20_14_0_80_42_17]
MTEPHFAGALLDATIFTARNGQPSLRLADRALMSAYDPGREAANKAQAIAASRICLVGLGLGYLADAFGERLVRVVVFPGEIERYLAVHAVEATSRAWGDRVQSVESVEEAGASIETSVRGGVAVVLDPATSADPALAAAMKDYVADAQWPARHPFSRPAPPAARVISESVLDEVMRHQDEHDFRKCPAIRFEFVPAPVEPRRILVLQPSSIGDVCYFTPALQGLRDRYPRAEIAQVVEREAVELIHGGVPDQVMVANRSEWKGRDAVSRESVRLFLARLAAFDADLVINPHATARCAWYAAVAAARGARILGLHFDEASRPVLSGNIHHLRWLSHMAYSLSDY